jgi:hypothetical protein
MRNSRVTARTRRTADGRTETVYRVGGVELADADAVASILGTSPR